MYHAPRFGKFLTFLNFFAIAAADAELETTTRSEKEKQRLLYFLYYYYYYYHYCHRYCYHQSGEDPGLVGWRTLGFVQFTTEAEICRRRFVDCCYYYCYHLTLLPWIWVMKKENTPL
jgi:hypothetical protein